jgi:hypothetical protein
MFDRCTVVPMHYEADGTQISREVYEGDVALFVEYQRLGLREGVTSEIEQLAQPSQELACAVRGESH